MKKTTQKLSDIITLPDINPPKVPSYMHILECPKITWGAKGVYLLISDIKNEWDGSAKSLLPYCTENENTIKKYIKELRDQDIIKTQVQYDFDQKTISHTYDTKNYTNLPDQVTKDLNLNAVSVTLYALCLCFSNDIHKDNKTIQECMFENEIEIKEGLTQLKKYGYLKCDNLEKINNMIKGI